MALGKQIRDHRKARGLTLEQLSEASSVDIGTISALENRDSVRSKFAIPLAAAMGMTAEQLETLPAESFIEGESPRVDSPSTLLVATLKPATEKEQALARLAEISGELDLMRIGQLIERATALQAEMPAKQTQKSSA